jgi:hypothetical protein
MNRNTMSFYNVFQFLATFLKGKGILTELFLGKKTHNKTNKSAVVEPKLMGYFPQKIGLT